MASCRRLHLSPYVRHDLCNHTQIHLCAFNDPAIPQTPSHMLALPCSATNNHNTPPNITILIASCPSDLDHNARDLSGLDHPPGMSSSRVTRCPITARPERVSASPPNQLPTECAPTKNATPNPNTDARKTPMTTAPPLVIRPTRGRHVPT